MIVEAFESYAKTNGRWLQTWNHAHAASIASVRIAFGQWANGQFARGDRAGERRVDVAH